ncbi:aldo/keto reductase [Collinsella sp. An2]|uniref:aldo/keto reductase n=1 Tax=Collinsella sp. An2 TaxID=1965585 RepID=UPI000B365111|nr:aldo/keto reductase [Collinsella sp. An2]OUP11159.1 2,5-diketo-D-gluconic acid reductase [Collinsella sp. An2]
MDTITLNNGIEMPLEGLGVFQVTDEGECERAVRTALDLGYRLVDTAACYGNERAVGRALKASGLPREEVFLTSKVWIQDAGYERTMASFDRTLENLGTDYLDLYLIHMPYGDYHGSWRAMEELLRAGRVRAIGVCNFLPDRLADLILAHQVVPAVNQIELHPFCQQRRLRQLMARYDIAPMAWAPFAEGQHGLFSNPTLTAIGAAHNKTAAQVVLRWLRQEGIIAIPKSVHEERICENFDIDDFELTPADLAQVDAMDEGVPTILDVPDVCEVYRLHGITFEQ